VKAHAEGAQDETAAPDRWQSIPGFFDFADFYHSVVASTADKAVFVEVGAWLGRSTAFLAEEIQRSGKRIELYVVDTWGDVQYTAEMDAVIRANGGNIFELFRRNMARCGFLRLLHPCPCESTVAARMFPFGSLDFCFIDADHSYECVQADIVASRSRVKPGGILAGHDYNPADFPEVVRAVHGAFAAVEVIGRCWMVRM
jgi:SAM-dependent methyltransferase